jgi:preprotein translocase subunit SecA
MKLLKKIFGTQNDRELRRLGRVVVTINALETEFQQKSDEELRAVTQELKDRLQGGEKISQILPEAFAAVREASVRSIGLRHFDVQMIGGMALHDGRISEMRTGEGKTLVATLPSYLNALTGEGVHLVTVNDYLARRDAHWMAPIFERLGISVGVIQSAGAFGPDNASFLIDLQYQSDIPNFQWLRACGRQEAYAADITYGTNNEFGFDYLRDNMVLRRENRTQRGLAYAIIDEVDSILIDEARTPLVISGMAEDNSVLVAHIGRIVPKLKVQPEQEAPRNLDIESSKVYLLETEVAEDEAVSFNEALRMAREKDLDLVQVELDGLPKCKLLEKGHFTIDEKMRTVDLTEEGHSEVEKLLIQEKLLPENESLYQPKNQIMLQTMQSGLRARHLFRKDVEYIVTGGEVVLIDEHTGRKMPGRRLGDGLHQAIEAKEGQKIQHESQTLASTTFQNFFRLYKKLAGMTGTADTEAAEFQEIYGLQVLILPTNKPTARLDLNDLIFLTKEEKLNAAIEDIKECQAKSAPVLVGTASIETSEEMSQLLTKAKIEHEVLNAKQHEREAQIIAEAGRPGRVTIATNMAGRGTDIVLGGNLEAELAQVEGASEAEIEAHKADWKKRHQTVIDAGGLHIISTERHESRRIDNQLRGRAGRQGDPGATRFYLAMDDNLMRLFASERVRNMMQALGMDKGEAIEHRMVTGSIEKAQRKVEGRNFDIRKQLLEYDDVANDQRLVVYQQRNELLDEDDISDILVAMRADAIEAAVYSHMPPDGFAEQWDFQGLDQFLTTELAMDISVSSWMEADQHLRPEEVVTRVTEALESQYAAKLQGFKAVFEQNSSIEDPDLVLHRLERDLMLQTLDRLWKEHLATMDSLRASIGLRGYAGRNPKQEYKRESFELFRDLLDRIKSDVTRVLMRFQLASPEQLQAMEQAKRQREEALKAKMSMQHADSNTLGGEPRLPRAPAQAGRPGQAAQPQPFIRDEKKVGRNEPCPCGSGKKYKQCHGAI